MDKDKTVAASAAAPKTMLEVFDALANLKTDPALIEKMKACMEVFSPNEAVIGPYHVFEAGRRAIRAAKHDQIACSLVNGRGTKCTCDAMDATTPIVAGRDDDLFDRMLTDKALTSPFHAWFKEAWEAYEDKPITNPITAMAWAFKCWEHLQGDHAADAAAPSEERKFTQSDMERYGKAYADSRDARVAVAPIERTLDERAALIAKLEGDLNSLRWELRDAHLESLEALKTCVEMMLHDGVPLDPEHPKRIAINVAQKVLEDNPSNKGVTATIRDLRSDCRHLYEAYKAACARVAAPQAALSREAILALAGKHKLCIRNGSGALVNGYSQPVAVLDFANELLATAPTERMSDAARDVLAEHARQISVEGFTPEHDDKYTNGELPRAAACYAHAAGSWMEIRRSMPAEWPWARDWWKPGTPRRMLEKAAAMIISEMERIDRAARKAEIERSGDSHDQT